MNNMDKRLFAAIMGTITGIAGGLLIYGSMNKKTDNTDPDIFPVERYHINHILSIPATNNSVSIPSTNLVSSVAPSFEEAKTNASVRQKFLDNLLRTNSIPDSEGVFYDHGGSGIIRQYYQFLTLAGVKKEEAKMIGETFESLRGGKFDVKTPEALELRGKGLKTKIFVGREIFEDGKFGYMNSEDFRHLIVSHAGRHAERYSKGASYLSTEKAVEGVRKGTLRPQVLYGLDDYDACGNDVRRIKSGEFKVSQNYSNSHNVSFLKAGLLLTTASRNASPLEFQAITNLQNQIRAFPELWDVQVPSKHYDDMKRFK
ncbi:MAG: hypothetical protein Q7R87_02855 [Nanoarchaeota archaeon]|nr:hypothetical protein [Nanoarchaeota archaeon]